MADHSTLSPRARQILLSIVRTHIETGEPVASSDISRLRRHRLSAASIRNVMAELASEGYLYQPHTSAGRLPTAKAYRVFVENLHVPRVPLAELGRLRGQLSHAGTVENMVERSCQLLMEMSQGVGIAAAIPTEKQTFDQVQLISLGERRVLMVLVTQDEEKLVRDQVVTLEEPVTQVELEAIRNYLNANFRGWMLSEMQAELRRRLDQASDAYGQMLRKLILLYEKGLLEAGLQPEVHLEGVFYLMSQDFHWTRERLREIFQTLEQKKRILELLERFLERPAGQVRVQIGLEEVDPRLVDLSLVGTTVRMPGGMPAKFAVLGPMRMDYERAFSAVFHLGQALGSLPA